MGGAFGGDVKMEILWDERGLFALQGPKAVNVIKRMAPSVDFAKVRFGQSLWVTLQGAECLVSRCGYTGEDGFEIFVPGEKAAALWCALRDSPEVRLAALGARDALRLEAGLCLYGHDIDVNTSPVDAGLSWVVGKARRSGARANFLGHEHILAQMADRKRLVPALRAGLIVAKGPPAREGALIETPEGEVVGKVTSGTMSPCLR